MRDDVTVAPAVPDGAGAGSAGAVAPGTSGSVPGNGADEGALLQVTGLKKYFPILGGLLRRQVGSVYAVDDVSFDIRKGEVLGLVGESGCGKTTLGRSIIRLTEPTAGTVVFGGVDVTALEAEPLRKMRRRMQIVFQDPFGSLNPQMPVSDIIGEGLLAQGVKDRK